MRCHAMRCQAMILVDAILRDGFARRCQTMRWDGTANEIKAMTIGCIVRRLAIVAMFPTIFPSLVLAMSTSAFPQTELAMRGPRGVAKGP